MPSTVLMVAEKPSIAQSIASILARGKMNTRKGASAMCSVHEFDGTFRDAPAYYKVTSVVGHVYSIDFLPQYQNWETVDPATLFDAPTRKEEANPKANVCRHLQKEAKGVDYLVLWLDCDREGENICFEVIENVEPNMNRRQGQQIFRAKFSAITAPDITRALNNLVSPNENEAMAVAARQELDLKVGVAFTRFQTKFFQGKYGNLDSTLISYGPCQTPTLGFCVERHDKIQQFTPEAFWTVRPALEHEGLRARLDWERGRVFEQTAGILFHNIVKSEKHATVESVTQKEGKKARPIPLNTVDLLKVCSQQLHIGPHHAMQIAERLYIQGYVSYPRTESTSYPQHFDINATLQQHKGHSIWGDYVASLLKIGPHKAKKGHDAGDHPPITPMASASESELHGDEWRIYEYITRHFIATVSPDCKFTTTRISAKIGSERFSFEGKKVNSPGYTLIMPWMVVKDEGVPAFKQGQNYPIAAVDLIEGKTEPPSHLTESELITLMEKHGIGTDASIPVHINNICERNFVKVEGVNRQLAPTHLGVALVHGYHKIDSDLVLPTVRSEIEKQLDFIAKGEVQFEVIVKHALKIFFQKFEFFKKHIGNMDELFGASFSTLAETIGSKLSVKCGKCKRFMKFIPMLPHRLYCSTCEETYSLPQNGRIKQYKSMLCPLDGFELVSVTLGSGNKSFPLCPFCYNYPTLEGMKKGMGCNNCPHPTCPNSVVHYGITECPECGEGTLVLDPASGPNWRLDCNLCNYLLHLAEGAHKITPCPDVCETCGSTKLQVDFHKDSNHPLLKEMNTTIHKGCLNCDEIFAGLTKEGHSRMRHRMFNRGRGRGRGRGRRSGRGRGRARS